MIDYAAAAAAGHSYHERYPLLRRRQFWALGRFLILGWWTNTTELLGLKQPAEHYPLDLSPRRPVVVVLLIRLFFYPR